MKHAIILISSGLLHLIPPICIAVVSTNPPEPTTAITVGILFFSTLGLGYWHGHQRTWSTTAPTTG